MKIDTRNVLIVCLIGLIIAVIVYDRSEASVVKAKAMQDLYEIERVNDSITNDNYVLLLNASDQEKRDDSLVRSNDLYIEAIDILKKKLHEKDHHYFNAATDSTIMSIFDSTNITP